MGQNTSKKMTNQQVLEEVKHEEHWVIFFLVILFVVLCAVGINAYHTKQRNIAYHDSIAKMTDDDQALSYNLSKPKYVIDAQGHMDYSSQNAIKRIRAFFMNTVSFTSEQGYEKSRKIAKGFIKDPGFFGKSGFFNPYRDDTGGSIIKNENLKRKVLNVHVYEVIPGQYVALIRYDMYHNPDDLNNMSSQIPSTAIVQLSGNSMSISHAKFLRSISANID